MHDARTNCLGTHAARVNSFGLHTTRQNSGRHTHSHRCACNSCGEVWEGTKPTSMSTRCQDRCPAVEKFASLQHAPGRLHVETWAGSDGNPACLFPRWWKSCRGVGHGDSPSPSSLLFRVTWAGQRSQEWDRLVIDGEKSKVWGVVFSGVPWQGAVHFLHLQVGFGGDRSLQLGRSSHFLHVLAHMRMGEARLGPRSGERCWPLLARLWRAIASLMKPWCAEGEPEPLSRKVFACGTAQR